MKKFFSFFTICMMVCLVSSSCSLRNFVKDLKAVAEEAEEISEGKYFTISSATVTYQDGTVLAFTDYGKNAYVKLEDEVLISHGDILYTLDPEEKTYIKSQYGQAAAASFVVPEKAMSAGEGIGKWASDLEVSSSERTIAGKTCIVWTVDGESVGSWHRVLMLGVYEDDEPAREAVSVKESADPELFNIPADYKEEGEEEDE